MDRMGHRACSCRAVNCPTLAMQHRSELPIPSGRASGDGSQTPYMSCISLITVGCRTAHACAGGFRVEKRELDSEV
jgi:hypothetical protein